MKKLIFLLTIFCSFFVALIVQATSTPEIIINEVMYNPDGTDSGHEWLEIVNVSDSLNYSIDDNWRFNDGSNHHLNIVMGDEIIAPSEHLVLVDNQEIFLQDYPDFQGTLVDTVISLNNSQDTLSLSIDGGETFFATTTYQSVWGGNDNGFSLEKINYATGSLESDWQESYILGGTPGQSNSSAPTNSPPAVEIVSVTSAYVNQPIEFTASSTDPDNDSLFFLWNFGDQATLTGQTVTHQFNQVGEFQVAVTATDGQFQTATTQTVTIEEIIEEEEEIVYSNQIIINEVLPNPLGSDSEDEFIELYNRGASEINLIGWKLSDATSRKYTINSGDFTSTKIAPFGYFVIYRRESGIALNNGGDIVELFQPNDNLLQQIEYAETALEGWSYAKNGGSWFWTVAITPGSQNIIQIPTEEEEQAVSLEPEESNNQPKETSKNIVFNLADYQALRINEFIPNPAGADSYEWIELYNNSSTTLNLSGFKLDDQEGGSKPYSFTASSSILAFDYLVIDKEVSRISLNNGGDSVRLISPDDLVFKEVIYEKAKADFSFNYSVIDDEWYWSANISSGSENIYVEEISEFSLESQGAIEEQFPFFSINEVKEFEKGKEVTTVGAVTVELGILGKNIIYISNLDPSTNSIFSAQGIQLYSSSVDLSQIKIGDVIQVYGKLSQIQGEKRINLAKDSQVELVNHIDLENPELIPIGDITDDLVGGLIYISGELVERKGSDYYLDDGTGEIRVYLKKTANITKPKVEKGFFLDVAGILTLTESGYRLLPRSDNDINAGQVLGEIEEVNSAEEVITLTASDQRKKVLNYLLASGGGVLLILICLFIKYKFFKK